MSLDLATIGIGMDTSGLENGTRALGNTERAANKTADAADKVSGSYLSAGKAISAFGLLAGAAALGAVVAINKLINSVATFQDMAEKTGASASGLASFKTAADVAGVSVESVAASMNRMSLSLSKVSDESKGAGRALAAIGINVEKFKTLKPDDQMRLVAKAMGEFADGTGKSAIAMSLFGRGGAEQLVFLKELAGEQQKNTYLTDDQIASADNYADANARMTSEVAQMSQAIAVQAIPAFTALQGIAVTLLKDLLDLGKAEGDLGTSMALLDWAENGALAIAALVESVVGLAKLLRAVGGSFQSVLADAAVAAEFVNPFNGTSISQALERRELVAREANKRYVDLWTEDGTKITKAVKESFAKQRAAVLAGGGASNESDKPQLKFNSPQPKFNSPARDSSASSSAKRAASEYDAATKAADRFIANLKRETETLGMTEKALRAYNAEIAAGLAPKSSQKNSIMAATEELEKRIAALASSEHAEKANTAWIEAGSKAFDDEREKRSAGIASVEEYIDGLNRQAEALKISSEEVAIAEQMHRLLTAGVAEGSPEWITFEANLRLAAAGLKMATDEASKLDQAKKNLDSFLDPTKAQAFGAAIGNSLGAAGVAMVKLGGIFEKQHADQKKFAAFRADNAKIEKKYPVEYAAAAKKITADEKKTRIQAYGDMASAAKGFFAEGTTGYKVLELAEKAFRMFEMAESVKAMAQQYVEMNTTVATDGVKTTSGIMAGAAKMFSQSGWAAFAGVAAMVALMASLGSKGGGGGSSASPSAKDIQAKQGTGGVLGDASAKSETLTKSQELLNKDFENSRRMLRALQKIENKIGGLAAAISRQMGVSGGMFDTSGLGLGVTTKWGGSIWGGNKTVTQKDMGINFGNQTVGQAASGIDANSYQTVNTATNGGWFRRDKSEDKTAVGKLDGEVKRWLSGTIASLRAGVVSAAEVLGITGAEATINAMQLGITQISMKDLTGDEITDQLNAVMGQTFDNMALAVAPDLIKFSKVGEGAGETLVRLANSLTVVNGMMGRFGQKLFDVSVIGAGASADLADAFGGVAEFYEAVSAYYETFYSDSERWTRSAFELALSFEEMGFSMPRTNAELRNMIDGLDLTTEAGRDMYATLIGLSSAFDEVIGEIERVGTSIKAMFADSIETIRLDVMDDAKKYDYWRGETDKAWKELEKATAPGEIERWSNRLNEAAMNAYGLLPADQKADKAQAFITYLEKAEALAAARLQIAFDQAQTVAASHVAAAEVQRAAAAEQKAAATAMATAVAAFAAAAVVPIPVAVAVTVDGGTTEAVYGYEASIGG